MAPGRAGGGGLKRLAGAGLALLVGLLLVAEWRVGIALEGAYRQSILAAQEQAAGRYRIEAGAYRRGWLVSTAQTHLGLPAPSHGEAVEIALRHDIVHGPVALGMLARGEWPIGPLFAVVDTRYDADPQRLPNIAASLAGRPLLRARARLGFDRSASVLLESPGFELDGGRLTWRGMRGDLELRAEGGKSTAVIEIAPLQLADEDAKLRLADSVMSFALERARAEGVEDASSAISLRATLGSLALESAGLRARIAQSAIVFSGRVRAGQLAFSELRVATDELEVTRNGAADESAVTLRGASLRQRSERVEGGPRSFSLDIGFEDLVIDADRYGPGRMDMALRGIDGRAWSALRQALDELASRDLEEPAYARARAALFARHMPEVLAPSPEVAVSRLELTGDDGILSASARIGVDGSDPRALTSSSMLASKVFAELKTSLPPAILNAMLDEYLENSVAGQAESLGPGEIAALAELVRGRMLARLLSDGTLLRDGNGYRLHARLRDGLASLNGQPADASLLTGIIPDF